MTRRRPQDGSRGTIWWGIAIGVLLGFMIAFVFQLFIPPLAKVPGFLICGGDELEIFLRRPTSFGVCGGDATRKISYLMILGVSLPLWSVVCAPIGIAIARWLARKAASGGPRGG